ncbi:YdeI/OmpD-associated family protein [Paenibacillus harenae]|uniref:Bifunctional DNA-binding transcriptional regulator/antitoxin component of YhaV-PrlF toxin-antitoxin module n=1 Tax=Paenibacillus harenae TaxID=306543 RepID=A0ABT9U9F8_PAEHA|nr:YdeI/OmpD-associated family protein [Paenibacillus harenae]MDQ0116266.1 bifunctional DNA-binding transcriptional regulator/antitoxin component of YhaV-PrlF toxin-antitoxin module [Paenibacillus harenae]
MKSYDVQTELLKHEGMDATFIEFPYDVQKEFKTKGQVKVKVVFRNGTEYRGSLVKMGMDCHCLGIPKAVRQQLGLAAGDVVHAVIYPDIEPRAVDVPDDLTVALRISQLEDAFRNKLSYSKQREAVQSIENAKKPETRARRVQAVLESLLAGK